MIADMFESLEKLREESRRRSSRYSMGIKRAEQNGEPERAEQLRRERQEWLDFVEVERARLQREKRSINPARLNQNIEKRTELVEEYCKKVEKSELDPDQFSKKKFEELCFFLCSKVEILGGMGTVESQLNSWTQHVYKKPLDVAIEQFKAPGFLAIRKAQMDLMKKNANMAIWMGKLHLGQMDPDKVKASEASEQLAGFIEFMHRLKEGEIENSSRLSA